MAIRHVPVDYALAFPSLIEVAAQTRSDGSDSRCTIVATCGRRNSLTHEACRRLDYETE